MGKKKILYILIVAGLLISLSGLFPTYTAFADDSDDTTVTFYEGYTRGTGTGATVNHYYITKETYPLNDSFNPFGGNNLEQVISESYIAYCCDINFSRPNVKNGWRSDSDYITSNAEHTHYTKLSDDADFITALDSTTEKYISYNVKYDPDGDIEAQVATLRDTLTRVIYYGYGGAGASKSIQGSVSEAGYRYATQLAIYYFTDGKNPASSKYWSSYPGAYDLCWKLIKGTDLPESDELAYLTLNIYQYLGDDNYYTSNAGKHPKAITKATSFQALITVETVPKQTAIKVTKSWDDADNQDGIRPNEVTIKLFADGEDTGKTVTLNADNNWTDSFTGLDKYKDGEEIAYTITEEAVENYSTTYDGYDVTNSYTPKQISVKVTKEWDDADDAEGIRPESVTVKLLADGEDTGKTVTLNADNNWTDSFTELDQYKAGEEIEYTVEEVSVDGYESSVSGNQEVGYTITNSHTPEDTTTTSEDDSSTPKTGDDNNIIVWGTLTVLAIAVLCALVIYRRRKER